MVWRTTIVIEVKNLTKKYGPHLAVDDISFKINEGEVVGFLGPNGAGKSTTMNILTGFLSATSGNASIAGFDVLQNPYEAKRRVGYLPEAPPLYTEMTVREYLNFVYDLKKAGYPRRQHIAEICRLVKITDVYHRLIKNLSKGYRQRVGIAQALIGNPEVLILDEPTVGLDPKQIIEIRTLIKQLGKNHTVILSSHILSEIQAVCERIIIINKGIIAADGKPDALSALLSNEHSVVIRVDGPEAEVTKELKKLGGVKSVINHGERTDCFEYVIDPLAGYDIRRSIFELLSRKKWPLLLMQSNEMTLEDVFLRLTSK